MAARLVKAMAYAWGHLRIQPRTTRTSATTMRATRNVIGFASREMRDDWGAGCFPLPSNPTRGKARIRRLGCAAHYIAGGMLAAIPRRRLEQKMTTLPPGA
ncbi:hypothetical protein RSO01_24610 [Reyranella soli]|uniref:Uncharacterized protein n=1 Tax=Reyranella soli TaxID=1230389 RepID=A0A512N8I7_9HYPH|nr:hypothetical protein RSO01_24610 [Reyranella soli]